MAQLVEHILGKDEVISSNLISSSRKRQILICRFLFSQDGGHYLPLVRFFGSVRCGN